MNSIEFPLVMSPNLGCPEIISVAELKKGETIPIIIAGQYGEFISPLKEIFRDAFFLRPSDGESEEIPLYLEDNPEEITGWNLLSKFSDIHETREIINSELHYNVLGEGTRYWKIKVSIKDNYYDAVLRKNGDRYLPKLFDLVMVDKSENFEKINYHSIQFVHDFNNGFNFIHLTDLHTAKRNDEILDEVLKEIKERSERGRKKIEESYINFNDKFREFIRIANDMADEGMLDFVVITGDLVDFAFHGWENESNPDENNWKFFINILRGAGKERAKNNPGIKVAVFTSTGNHDWRLHPYNPNLGGYSAKFGLRRDELKHYGYKSFDSTEYPEDERAKLSKEITSEAFKKLKIEKFTDKVAVKLAKYFSGKITTWIRHATIPGLLVGGGSGLMTHTTSLMELILNEFIYLGILGFLFVLGIVVDLYIEKKIRKMVDIIVDNPLHAEAKALHHYLKYINPYFDYAFKCGNHSFIVMDTGADIFVAQLLEQKETKHMKKMSIEDNILGGSPDSRAFDSEQRYYNWSQIVWLEKVLSVLGNKDMGGTKNTFIFLHAPPINPEDKKRCAWSELRKNEGKSPKWISKDKCNLTYGTINYYRSQFLYLCIGYRENELITDKVNSSLKEVDVVFSGHAHRNIEFKIEKEWIEKVEQHEIRIYSDVYSQLLKDSNPQKWWKEYKPIIVQTASCGLQGKNDEEPPYFRKVTIDNNGQITDFRVRNNKGVVSFS